MKLSKVLSLVIAFAMLLTASTMGAYAFSDVDTDLSNYEAIMGLSALDILNGYEDGTFLPEGKITRAEFATVAMRAMGVKTDATQNTIFTDVDASHWASGYIAEAFAAGVVNGRSLEYAADGVTAISGTFDPEAEVSYDEAVKMIVCAMGYQLKAESLVKKGVNPFPTAYNLIANQSGVTNNTVRAAGGATRATVAQLTWNALPVKSMEQTKWGDENAFSEVNDASLLFTKQKAVLMDTKIEGVSLDQNNKTVNVSNYVLDEVSEYVYTYGAYTSYSLSSIKKGACDVAEYQGYSVKALVDISDVNDPTFLAIFPTAKNTSFEVDAELFVGLDASNRVEYYASSDANTTTTAGKVGFVDKDNNPTDLDVYVNKIKKADNTVTAAANLNPATSGNVTNLSENPGHSKYTFVDTDNNGAYDTLFIDNYASFVVGNVNVDDDEITQTIVGDVYPSLTGFEAMDTGVSYDYDLVLDPDKDSITWTMVDEEGKELTIEDIEVGDVITYAMSKEGSLYHYDITVCKASTITGTIDALEEKALGTQTLYYYTIGDTEYLLNDKSSDLEPGVSGTFSITADGNIIACELDATARNFAVGIQVAQSQGSFSQGIEMQVMTADGTVTTLPVAKDIYYNTTSTLATATNMDTYTNAATFATTLQTAIMGKPFMYEVNSNGEVKRIFIGDAIKEKTDDAYEYKTSSGSYAQSSNKINGNYFVDTSVVVGIDGAASAVPDDYSLASASALVDGDTYSYNAIVADRDVALMVIPNFEILPAYDSVPMYVTGVSTISKDGAPVNQYTGYVGKEQVSYTTVEDGLKVYLMGTQKTANDGIITSETVYDTLGTKTAIGKGDVIQFILNGAGEIKAYRHIVKVDSGVAYFLVANDQTKTDNEDTGIAMDLVAYNLTKYTDIANVPLNMASTVSGKITVTPLAAQANNMNGVDVDAADSVANLVVGYAAFGRIERFEPKTIGIFDNTVAYATGVTDALADENKSFDVSANPELPVYVNALGTNSKFDMKSTSASFKSYKSTNRQIDKTDDVVYVMSYDGDAVFQYVIDSMGNNYN